MIQQPPLLLLSGLLCDKALWRPQVNALADIADIFVPELTEFSSIEEMATVVLEDAPDFFALAGLSMGGYISQEILRREPDRISRLALLDTSYYEEAPERVKIRKDYIEEARNGHFEKAKKGLLPLLIHPDRQNDTILTAIISGMAERVGSDAYVRQQTAILNRVDGTDDLPKIVCPTLILCGRQDALTPLSHHKEMSEKIPNATLTVVENCGHLSTLERPEAVNAAMRGWLLEQ